MGLAEIADGLTVTESQRNRGVATVDTTERPLEERLEPFVSELPCSGTAAAELIEAYTAGSALDVTAEQAGVARITAVKTLYLLGIEGLWPLGPAGREIIQDWLAARISRTEARELTQGTETEFQLAVFMETHEPIEGAYAAIEPALQSQDDPAMNQSALSETMSSVDDLTGANPL